MPRAHGAQEGAFPKGRGFNPSALASCEWLVASSQQPAASKGRGFHVEATHDPKTLFAR